MSSSPDVVEVALFEVMVGCRFKRGGRDPTIDGDGIDCLGVVYHGLRLLGADPTDPWVDVQARWREGWKVGDLMDPAEFREVALAKAKRGDVLELVDRGSGAVALVVAPGLALYANESIGVGLWPIARLKQHAAVLRAWRWHEWL